jgi:hypothetical protein
MTWSIEIENILLRNNNAAYIRNGFRAARPGTRYLDNYNYKLEQYNRDLKAYDAAVAAFEAASQGRALVRSALPKKLDKAKGKEKKNSRHKKRSGLTHLWMLSKAFTTL